MIKNAKKKLYKKDWQWFSKSINWFLLEIFMIKELWILIDPKVHLATNNQDGSFKCYIPLMTISIQKTIMITWFFPQILIIKESCNWPGWETKLALHNQKGSPHAIFPWWLFPCKKSKRLLNLFQIYWWSKNPEIWLGKKQIWHHPTKSGNLRCYLPLMIMSTLDI